MKSIKAIINTTIDPINIYEVPIFTISNPPTLVPIVTPILAMLKKIPLANSGALGAAETIHYCKRLLITPPRNPHNITRIVVGIAYEPIINNPINIKDNTIGVN